jgi:hypothetical protein
VKSKGGEEGEEENQEEDEEYENFHIIKPCITFKTRDRINLNYCKIDRKNNFFETKWVKDGKVTI